MEVDIHGQGPRATEREWRLKGGWRRRVRVREDAGALDPRGATQRYGLRWARAKIYMLGQRVRRYMMFIYKLAVVVRVWEG